MPPEDANAADDVTPDAPTAPVKKPRASKTKTVGGHDGSTQTMNWYDRTPLPMQMFMQFGFAGLFVLVFWMQFRENSAEARANREMYREEQHAMRMEIRATVEASEKRNDSADKRNEKIAASVVDMTNELRRATDELRRAGLKLKDAAEKIEAERGGIPPPRDKGGVDGVVSGPGGCGRR